MHDAPILSDPHSLADQLHEVKRKLQENDPMGALQVCEWMALDSRCRL